MIDRITRAIETVSKKIIQHVTSDKLVMWGWSPGEGRSTPPLGHDEFAQKMADWARYGAACPK